MDKLKGCLPWTLDMKDRGKMHGSWKPFQLGKKVKA